MKVVIVDKRHHSGCVSHACGAKIHDFFRYSPLQILHSLQQNAYGLQIRPTLASFTSQPASVSTTTLHGPAFDRLEDSARDLFLTV